MSRMLLTILLGLLFASVGNSSANALAFYTDQAAWNAAVSGLSIGPYEGLVTIADTTTTLERGFPPCDQNGLCVSGQTLTTTTQTDFTSLVREINRFRNDCYVTCSSITDTTVTFSTPILALAATGIVCADLMTINGQMVPFDITNAPCGAHQFFGLTSDGPLSSLDFNAGCCSDDNNHVNLRNIVVATVPEPHPFAIVLAGLITICTVFLMQKKPQARS